MYIQMGDAEASVVSNLLLRIANGEIPVNEFEENVCRKVVMRINENFD